MSEASHAAGVSLADHLQQLTETLAATHAQEAVLAAALQPAMTALGALAGAILLLNPEIQFLSIAAVQGDRAKTVWQDGPLSPETPAGDALLTKTALYFEHAGALTAAYPLLEEQSGGTASVATTIQPLLLEGQPLGVLILDFKDPHTFSSEEKRFLTSLAAQCSVALNRAQLIDRLQASEMAFRRLVEISPVGMGIGSLDGNLTLVNDAWLKLLGQTRAAFETGEINWQALTPPEYAAVEQQAFKSVLSQGGSFTYDKEMLTPAGNRVPFQATMARFDERQVVGYAMDLRPFQIQQRVLEEEGVRLEHLVQERTGALRAEQLSSQAFMTFTEVASHTTDVDELAQLALTVLQDVLPGSSVGFYELEGEHWYARHLTADMGPELQATLRAGVPADMPTFAEMVRTGAPVFIGQWNAVESGVEQSDAYEQAAFYPIVSRERVYAALVIGVQHQDAWSNREHGIVAAVGRSFSLLYDRISIAERLRLQSLETDRRNEVLEAFAALSAELNVWQHAHELIRRAQEIVLSLLPDGHALYWEPVDGLWRCRAQVGEVGNADLQATIDAGVPIGQFPTIDQPWQTGEPEYQSRYAAGRDLPVQLTDHVEAVAALPVYQGETLRGVINFTLTEPHVWRAVDHVVLETVQQSLSVALDRLHQQGVILQQGEEAKSRAQALEGFAELTRDLALQEDTTVLIRRAQEVVLSLLPAGYSLYFEPDLEQDRWMMRAQTGGLRNDALQSVANAGLPYGEAGNLLTPYTTREPYYQDEYAEDTDNLEGMVTHLGASATFPVLVQGQSRGVFAVVLFGARRPWTTVERIVMETVVRSLGLALERAEQARQLQQRNEQITADARAQTAFVAFTEAIGVQTDVLVLVAQAIEVLRARFPEASVTYYELEGQLWKGRLWSEDVSAEVIALMTAGFPLGTPIFTRLSEMNEAVFTETWTPETEQIENTEEYGAVGGYPLVVGNEMCRLFTVGLKHTRRWSEPDRALVRAVGRGLTLALERAHQVVELAQQSVKLEQSNQDLESANGELEAFTYSASHDLRTPVRHVMGFAELAQKALEKTPNEKVSQHLEVVKQGAIRMTTLIDAMLLLSRSGRQELHVQPVNLKTLVTQARRDVVAEFGSHPVRWQIGELPTVQGDHSLLQQVMTNLLSNAVKYSTKREVSEVSVWCEENASEWTIQVQDNGVGFDPNYAQKLFGIFQRLHNEKEFKGTGIGLATTRRIVQKHGGQVFAESDGLTGAKFGFSLPK